MPTVAIAGASGYAGAELVRLIHSHPDFELVTIAAASNAGSTLGEVHPQFAGVPELAQMVFSGTTPEILDQADVVFVALPHGQSAALAGALSPKTRIVDLGADFRLKDSAAWDMYYCGTHAGTWTYGMPELPGQRELIASSTRVANPGCYATALSLGLAPLVATGLVATTDIVVVAASGTSGAGRSAKVHLLASEIAGSMSTYKIGGTHQHTPEVEQTLSGLGQGQVTLSFTPMLAPMSRGILATISAHTTSSLLELRRATANWYDSEAFVTLLPDGQLPHTASTLGSNSVHIQIAKDERTSRATIVVALDNLLKGASGQALQNANLMFGFPEQSGLSAIGVAP